MQYDPRDERKASVGYNSKGQVFLDYIIYEIYLEAADPHGNGLVSLSLS